MRNFIDRRATLLVIRIGQDFERRLMAGLPADVQVIADGRNSNTGGTALGYASTVVDSFNAEWRADHGQLGPHPGRRRAPGTTRIWKRAGA